MEEELKALEQCLAGLPESSPEAIRLIGRILPTLEKWSYAEQTGSFLLEQLKSRAPGCKDQLESWLVEVRNPGHHRRYALPGAPPPPPRPGS
ncbi:MAG: hypothetical protein U0931_31285 [Vulcanimicrobiota bacterium]